MLKLKDIKKTYKVGDLEFEALKGVSVEFRKSEFVSILGPSGCGKTTLLNIIGGLDRYTSGNMSINGKPTDQYKDKDWDNYRNHSVGFVFQSYNLIPHQSVLENVELALTLSGVSKKERKQRAISVLKKVGLGDKIKNRPNQLSGGQMQRVAIARALVNDPEIILADEPTGALDSETSVQIMNLLKEISKDKLIIMVTHNPELAERYSSRIVKLLDGKVIEDNNPFDEEEKAKEKPLLSVSNDESLNKNQLSKKNKKKRMSFFTALALSFKNLLTKKGRTILVTFAGSIGIIGIALVLAISSGFSTYVNKMQEDTLSTYPITIQAKSIDYTSILMSMFTERSESTSVDHDLDGVYDKDSMSSIINNVGENLKTNNLTKFYKYINEHFGDIEKSVNAVQYTYDLDLEFYGGNEINSYADVVNVQPNSMALVKMIVKYAVFYFENQAKVNMTQQMDGSYIITANENSNSKFLKDSEKSIPEFTVIKEALFEDEDGLWETPKVGATTTIDYVTILKLSFKMVGFGNMVSDGGTLNTSSFSVLSNSDIFYEMIDNSKLLNEQYQVLAGNFVQNSGDALLVLDKNNEVDEYMLYALGLLSDSQMANILYGLVHNNKQTQKIDYNDILGTKYKVLDESDYYVAVGENSAGLAEDTLVNFKVFNIENIDGTANPLYSQTRYYTEYAKAIKNCENTVTITGIVRLKDSSDTGSLSTGVAYTKALTNSMINYHNAKAETNENLSKIDMLTPSKIYIYVSSFESKAVIQNFIQKYNAQAEQGDEISYTDYVGVIMSTVSTIINAITYVLIAFVAVSLVVSSIMIGIITYISVIERTKEIGVLRSVGASKRDVSRVFTAESFIIGLTSGVVGIVIPLLLIIPINLILEKFTSIAGLASLPVGGAFILIGISIILTLIAGFFPSKVAARKDPVVALRTE